MFYLIGLGVAWKNLSIEAAEALKKCDEVFVEGYTSLSDFSMAKLERLIGKRVKVLFRDEVEGGRRFIDLAKKKNIALLIYGDPLSATTHFEMIEELRRKKIKFKIIHSSSIFTVIAETGLMLYKFGKTGSIPFWQKNFEPESFFDILEDNFKIKAHTLFLLDLDPKNSKFMTPRESVDVLLKISKKRKSKIFDENTLCIACSSLGMKNSKVVTGKASEILKKRFDDPPHCLIVPASLNDSEQEFLQSI